MPTPLRAEEGLNRPLQRCLVHAGPRIRDRKQHISSRCKAELVGVSDHLRLSGNRQAPAFRHGVACIHAEIEDRHLDLVRIRHGGRQVRRNVHRNLDLRPRGAGNEVSHAGDQGLDVDRPRLERLPARKGKQALHQESDPFGRLQRPGDQPLLALAAEALPLQEVEASDDGSQQIVDVVGNAAGQLAHAFELLALPKRVLGALQLRSALEDPSLQRLVQPLEFYFGRSAGSDVLGHSRRQPAALVGDREGAIENPADGPVWPDNAILDLRRLTPGLLGERLRCSLLVVRMDGAGISAHVLVELGSGPPPEPLIGGTDVGDFGGIQVRQVKDLLDRVGKQPEALLAFPDALGGCSCVRDVVEQHGHTKRVPGLHGKDMNIIPAAGRTGRRFQANWIAALHDQRIGFVPVLLEAWSNLARPATSRILEAGVAFKGRVDLDNEVIGRSPFLVEPHFRHAETGIHRLEQGTITFLAFT